MPLLTSRKWSGVGGGNQSENQTVGICNDVVIRRGENNTSAGSDNCAEGVGAVNTQPETPKGTVPQILGFIRLVSVLLRPELIRRVHYIRNRHTYLRNQVFRPFYLMRYVWK